MSSTFAFTRPRVMSSRVARASITVAAAGLAVKSASLLKEVVVAGVYGRSDAMDAFATAILLPSLLVNVVSDSFQQAFVPTLMKVRLQRGSTRAQQLVSSSLVCLVLLLVSSCLVVAALAPWAFPLLSSGFSRAKRAEAMQLFFGLMPIAVLAGLTTYWGAVSTSLHRYLRPALAPVAVSLVTMTGVLLFHRSLGIWALVGATVLGAGVQLLVVTLQTRPDGYVFRLRWNGWEDGLDQVMRTYGAAVLSCLVASGGLIVDQAMVATLPSGSVATLAYAGRFSSVFLALSAGTISTVATPHFSELVARGDWRSCLETLSRWSRMVFLGCSIVAALLIVCSRFVVRTTLQHGTFTAADTAAVAPVFVVYALQIPFFAASRISYRFLLAMGRTDLVLYCGASNLVLNVVLDYILMRWLGVMGLALSTSLWVASSGGLLWVWSRRLAAAKLSAVRSQPSSSGTAQGCA